MAKTQTDIHTGTHSDTQPEIQTLSETLPEWASTHLLCTAKNSSWIEISKLNVEKNLRAFRDLSKSAGCEFRLGTVLKGNAYGHGFVQMLPVVHSLVDVLYVIAPQDGLAIREYEKETGAAPCQVLVLGAIEPEECVELAHAQIDITLSDISFERSAALLKAAMQSGELANKARIHVHIDTGLCREGFVPADIPVQLSFLRQYSDCLEVVGMLSHFANTEDVTEQSYALEQLANFDKGCAEIQKLLNLKTEPERHFAASAATLVLPQSRFDTVRVGIATYGLWPSAESRLSAKIVLPELPKLAPVLSWHCRSQVVKMLPAGSYVGYGCTYRCSEATRVAVLPVGYFDGYPRHLSGKAHVLVNGKRAPVLGRIMMNHIVVDVTRATSDESPLMATLLGTQGGESLSVETLAGWGQTIHYEMVTRLGGHLKRIVVDS